MAFKQLAKRQKAKLKMFISGPSGSGKTYSALAIMSEICKPDPFGVADSEKESSKMYADKFKFYHEALKDHSLENYIATIHMAEDNGMPGLVIDSLSHAWMGSGGALEAVNEAAKKSRGNSYVAWRDVTPLWVKLIEAQVMSPIHIIATARSKMDYETVEENGRKVVQRIGMKPICREGMEYEYQIAGELDHNHNLDIYKSWCSDLQGKRFHLPTELVAMCKTISNWLDSGETSKEPERASESVIEALVAAFDKEHGISSETLSERIGRPIRNAFVIDVDSLRAWYKNLQDSVDPIVAAVKAAGMEVEGGE